MYSLAPPPQHLCYCQMYKCPQPSGPSRALKSSAQVDFRFVLQDVIFYVDQTVPLHSICDSKGMLRNLSVYSLSCQSKIGQLNFCCREVLLAPIVQHQQYKIKYQTCLLVTDLLNYPILSTSQIQLIIELVIQVLHIEQNTYMLRLTIDT